MSRVARGRIAEDAVADYLVARGFDVVMRNVRLGALEIDLVARRGGLAVVVEVRTRGKGSFTGPLASVDATKRARLLRACGRLWREKLRPMSGVERMRIDVAGVTVHDGKWIVEYIEGALTG